MNRAPGPGVEGTVTPAVIGREGELNLIEAWLDAAEPGARALLLQGEAGIGKTTIWHAALDAADRRGHRLVVTRPTEAEARLPFAGLNDLFGDLLDAGPALPPPQQRALEVALMRATAEGEPMPPLALSLAVLELMRIASSERPLVVAVDDVQWLDESSAAVLRFAVRRLEGERVVVIATERTSSAALPALLADLPAEGVARVAVTGLGIDEIDGLLGHELGLQLAPSMLSRVTRLSGGSPFYAIEIGRALQAGSLDLTADSLPLPESLGGLVRDRLASLPPPAREVAIHVAMLANPTESVLGAALDPERVATGLTQARDAGVLAAGDDPIRFTHPLLATGAVAAVDEAVLAGLHRRLAAAVPEPEQRARHLALGATGPDANAAAALDAAATRAHARGAPDAAAELSCLAAALTSDDDPKRARRLAAAGRYRLVAGDPARARDLLERALEEPAAARGPARAELLYRLATVRQLMDDFGASNELGREALRQAGDNRPLVVQIKLLLAGVSFITGRDWTEGSRHAPEAMRLAEQLGDPRLLLATIGPSLSWSYDTGGGFDRELARRAAELDPLTADIRSLDLPDFAISKIEYDEGQTVSAHERVRRLVEHAERQGDYSSLPFLDSILAFADFLDGRADSARARIDRATRLSRATSQRTAQVHVLGFEARLFARLGEVERARQAGREAFELMDSTGWRVGEWWIRTDLALLELSRGDPSAALDLVVGALAPVAAGEAPRRHWAQGVAVEALVALGRSDEAISVLHDLDEHVSAHGSPRLRADALRARARVLAVDGDIDAADAAIAEAEVLHRRMDDGWELARTLLVRGEIHRRARRRARARAVLREANEAFVFLGARSWARQASEQLGRIDAPRETGGLTPTQRKVAELVAAGMTNRQAADKLFMSPHTVEAHLSAVYRALGIGSRADLAVALATDRATPRDWSGQSRDSATS